MAAWLPMLALAVGVKSALALMVVEWMIVPLAITPSLAYMAEVTSVDGADAYGVGYGVYNTAWAIGLLIGPALGGFAFDRVGFASVAHRVVGRRDRRSRCCWGRYNRKARP